MDSPCEESYKHTGQPPVFGGTRILQACDIVGVHGSRADATYVRNDSRLVILHLLCNLLPAVAAEGIPLTVGIGGIGKVRRETSFSHKRLIPLRLEHV